MVNYESIYPGVEYTSAMPSHYTEPIANYQANIATLGMAMDARTANQLGELNTKMNPGAKTFEVQGISGQTMESIPNQHLDEMRRLAKLTGVEPTLHGPLLNASGVEREGYTDEQRIGVEKQMESALLRAHKLDINGNIPVTFHSSANLPEFAPHTMKDGKKVEEGVFIIDQDTGQIGQIRKEKRFLPEEGEFTGKRLPFDTTRELERRNKENWLSQLSRVGHNVQFGENAIDRVRNRAAGEGKPLISYDELTKIQKIDIDEITDEADKKRIIEYQGELDYGHVYLKESYRNLRDLFDKSWSAAKEGNLIKEQEKLKKYADWTKDKIKKDFENDPRQIEKLRSVVDRGLRTLSTIKTTPEVFKPLREFAIEKSAETFANVAESAYNEFGSKAPIVSIENPPGGEALSTGQDLRTLVVKSREQLAKNLSAKGMSRGQAKDVATKMIGATWDVGHINMMRKKGYSEKDIIKETKKIAPFVKHVHLSDNFGLDHTELPMGMGNVPLKPMINEIKKAGFDGKQIIEAGNWWQFFADKGGGNPFLPSIEAFDSPIYSMKEGPGWANTGVYGAYFSGHGAINPPIHHNTYGAGFQTLPIELGGEIPGGDRGRFAGG